MRIIEFQTERLLVRRWEDSDFEVLQSVYGDADAMRWVGDGEPLTAGQCNRWLEVTRTNYEVRGYGMFAVEQKTSGRAVGFCGIVHPGGQTEPEVKYAYLRVYWGLGFATEALAGLLRYGHQAHGLSRIIATTHPANAASHRVLLKSGMQCGMLRENEDGSRTQVFHWQPADRAA